MDIVILIACWIFRGSFIRLQRPIRALGACLLVVLWWLHPASCCPVSAQSLSSLASAEDGTAESPTHQQTAYNFDHQASATATGFASTSFSSDEGSGLSLNGSSGESHETAKPVEGSRSDSRVAFGIRGGFTLPQNDLKLTTGTFPNVAVGAYSRFRLGSFQQLRAVGEWWSFSGGVQYSQQPARNQTLRTNVQAIVMGGEYLCRMGGGPLRRFALGGGPYLTRWLVDSTNSVTLPSGTARATGSSQWIRMGGGLNATYRISRRLDLESRWIHTSYGYEHLPVNVVILDAGWTF